MMQRLSPRLALNGLAGSASLAGSLLLAGASCGSKRSTTAPVTVDVSGTEGTPIPAENRNGVLLVDLAVNGARGNAIVDTGSPIVVLSPASFPDGGLPSGEGTVAALTLGPLTFHAPTVVGADVFSSTDPSLPLGGSLGCGVLCAFVIALDYRGASVTIGPASPPAGVALPGATVPFSLAGGGLFTIDGVPGTVTFPASRIPVSVTVEGQIHTLLLDSGSSFMVLRQSVLAPLLADGRAQLDGIGTVTQGMDSASTLARLRSVVVGGEEVDGVIGSSDPALDASLDGIVSETGSAVDGLIGGSFLRNFHVTVDYPASTFHLRKYTTGAPTYDVLDRVGLTLNPATGGVGVTVAYVFPGTDAAAKGISVGDVVTSIDGATLASDGVTALNARLAGPVGSTKTLAFGRTSTASLVDASVAVGVDDVLPL